MAQGTTTGHLSDTSLIETALNEFGGMIKSLAIEFHYPYEDLRQDLAVVMLEYFDRLPENRSKLKAYLRTAATHLLIDHIRMRSHFFTICLSHSEEDDTPLAEILMESLAAPSEQIQDTTEQDQKVEALYAALRRLPLDEQRYVREVFGLNAYQPLIYDYKTREKDRTRKAVSLALYRHLRSDAQLASEVLP